MVEMWKTERAPNARWPVQAPLHLPDDGEQEWTKNETKMSVFMQNLGEGGRRHQYQMLANRGIIIYCTKRIASEHKSPSI